MTNYIGKFFYYFDHWENDSKIFDALAPIHEAPDRLADLKEAMNEFYQCISAIIIEMLGLGLTNFNNLLYGEGY